MRIYVDTSVFGGCFDPEFELWSNRLMHLFQIGKYTAVISDISEFELNFAPGHIQHVLTQIPVDNLEIVKLSAEAKTLSDHYLKERIVNKKSLADTQHIAIATINRVDLLVSWNFKHIVNYDKIRLYNAVNLKYGYRILEIRNPRDLTDES
jgi:hypothetical protein